MGLEEAALVIMIYIKDLPPRPLTPQLCKYFHLQAPFGCSVSTYTKKVVSCFKNGSPQGTVMFCSLSVNAGRKEEIMAGSRCTLPLFVTVWPCSWHY